MSLKDLKEILEAVPGFKDKVVYYAWPKEAAPDLPFICYLVTDNEPFGADNITYYYGKNVAIELYTRYKDTDLEALIEEALENAEIFFDKEETFLDDENCYEIIYNIEV